MKCHPVWSFSIARDRVDDETLGSALSSGGEFVGATHGHRQIFKVAFQFVAVGAFYIIIFSISWREGLRRDIHVSGDLSSPTREQIRVRSVDRRRGPGVPLVLPPAEEEEALKEKEEEKAKLEGVEEDE